MVKGQSAALYALVLSRFLLYNIATCSQNGVMIISVVGHAKSMWEEWWVTGCSVSDIPRLMTIMWPRLRLPALRSRCFVEGAAIYITYYQKECRVSAYGTMWLSQVALLECTYVQGDYVYITWLSAIQTVCTCVTIFFCSVHHLCT